MTEEPTTRAHPFSRTEAHPFEEPEGGGDACAFCGEPRTDILHHPTRIRAACLLHGLDPSALLTTRRRRSRS
jgi:hypothetical protein